MKQFTLLFSLILFVSVSALAQNASLDFNTSFDCDNDVYCTEVSVSSTDANVELGTSSIFIRYNKEALTFKSYESVSFNENTMCEGAPRFGQHQYDALNPGIINTTFVLNTVGNTCNVLSNEPIVIANICFDITNENAASDLTFSSNYTHLNKSDDNLTLVSSLELNGKTESLSCATSGITNIASSEFIEITPNPVSSIINANVALNAGDYSVIIYDLNGKVVSNKTVQLRNNMYQQNIGTLANGVYLISFEQGDVRHSKRFVKQ